VAVTAIPPQQLEHEVIEWCDSVYSESEQELAETHESKITSRLIDYISGRQWLARARFGRSRPVINRTFRQFLEMVGLLTDLELDFTVRFHDKIDGFSELEKKMNGMIVDWAFDTDFETELGMAIMWGLIHTGPVKIQWNPLLNNGWGDVQFNPLGPLNFMRIATGRKTQESEVCISREVVTLAELKRRHGRIAESVKPEAGMSALPGAQIKPARLSRSTWMRLNPVLKKMLGEEGQDQQTNFPRILRKEYWLHDDTVWEGKESIVVGPRDRDGKPLANWSYWVEPGMALYPRGRVIVTAGHKVLEDSPNPYWDGKFPFAEYRAFTVPWLMQTGLSPMEPIAAMQAILNRIYGGVMDTINAAIEPRMIAPRAAFSQQDFDAIDPGAPAAKILYNNNTPRAPEFPTPPQLPAYVKEYKDDVAREMDMTSGASAISQAIAKKQVPGGDALDMIFNSRSTNIRLMGRNLKSFLIEAGGLTVSRMLQFYTAKHRIAKYGIEGLVAADCVPFYGHALPKGIKPEEFVRKATFSIRRGSLLSIEKQEKIPIAFALRKQGDLSRHGLYRFLDVNMDLAQNDRELKEELAEKAAIAVGAKALQERSHHKQ
jgi:hypothetical protein